MRSASLQGELWGRRPATWADTLEPQMRPLYEAALEALEPLAGRRFLDAGCGAGLVVRLAADRGAVTSGLDASPGLLEVARARTPQADLCVGDIESLPYDDAVRALLTEVLEADRKPNGELRQDNVFSYVTAAKRSGSRST